ncbi:MAG: D-glycero-beta-D-manno-heptose 1-phosphate adenylyltransferase [Acidiferrobacterales bacterium]|nr:D-glycero-beta-D-manno-heptose 1-phosphate adenylyltransferase [Acidiferrobacterales bacterium]
MSNADSRIADAENLESRLASLARPIVFTNGCFDILHRGHITYLAEAAALGKSLVIGINTDESVRRLNKAPDRPFNSLEDRMAVLAALRVVDLVVPFDEDTPLELIKKVRPDYLVKGGDWKIADIVGNEFVTENGGQVHSIPFRFQRSTTALVNRIRGQ